MAVYAKNEVRAPLNRSSLMMGGLYLPLSFILQYQSTRRGLACQPPPGTS